MNPKIVVGIVALTLLAVACSSAATPTPTATPQPTPANVGGMANAMSSEELVPPVRGLYKGEELFFIHTEASDPEVANLLTMMMGPKVLLLPSLTQIPDSVLANVYVFTNGVKGGGPFGFQPDVFDSVPGDSGYSPLRSINLVAWEEGAITRELGSVAEIMAAESKGDVTIKQPDIVVNMPMLSWPGGRGRESYPS